MSAAAVAEAPAPAVGWLMASDAARVSGMSIQTLRELALAGRIPAWALLEVGKNGGRWRYSAKWCAGEGRK